MALCPDPQDSHHSHQSSQISRLSKFLQSFSAVKVSNFSATKTLTPVKINVEHHHRGLEDHFPFQMGVICRFHVNLPGVLWHFIALVGIITYPHPRHVWVDDVPFPVWWDMLVPLRVYSLVHKGSKNNGLVQPLYYITVTNQELRMNKRLLAIGYIRIMFINLVIYNPL